MRRPTLAGQLLSLQALVVVLVVLGATPVLLVQDEVSFRRAESRRVLATAETIADNPVIRSGLTGGRAGVPGEAERARGGSSFVTVTAADGEVVYASDPTRAGTAGGAPQGGDGGATVGVVERDDVRSVVAWVPVLAASATGGRRVGDVVGYVGVGRDYPSTWDRLGSTAPTLVVYVVVGSLVGIVGSLLLSRRIKRQTLGLEPEEIVGLVEQREAMLHGLREGVVGVDLDGRLVLVNDEAVRLLDPQLAVGGSVEECSLPPQVREVVGGRTPAEDLAVGVRGRVLVLNQMPVRQHGRHVGWVTTVRDRTEMIDLNRQVDTWRGASETLRAQSHEFVNRMHTIAGLIELGEHQEARAFVTDRARVHQAWVDRVVGRIEDAPVAAYLVAKGSQAAERGRSLELDETSSLPTLASTSSSARVLTVLGNLLDNALDAVASPDGRVVVRLRLVHRDPAAAALVELRVADDGPGVPDEAGELIFEQGWSTKTGSDPGGRGWGLTLARLVCRHGGGDLEQRRDRGWTVFTATVADLATGSPDPVAHTEEARP
jgi:two-component system, CitB family, sensor kinase